MVAASPSGSGFVHHSGRFVMSSSQEISHEPGNRLQFSPFYDPALILSGRPRGVWIRLGWPAATHAAEMTPGSIHAGGV
jgi:hypothetical protein